MARLFGNPNGKSWQAINFFMEYTGERMVPDKADLPTFWEHIYRYRFASRFVRGKAVLDIACGEGYGTAALLKAGATKVTGVDISQEACDYANKKYGIETKLGSAEAIPLGNASVDMVVSFETIEHVTNPAVFLDECLRILRPNGQLVISTPNRDAYHKIAPQNPFHCSELSHAEFAEICEKRFQSVEYFSQRPVWTSRWSLRGLAMPMPEQPNLSGNRKNRLGWKLQPWLCPNISKTETERYQQNPVEAILAHSRLFSSLADPYAIRRFVSNQIEDPIYTIAVARRA
jgi:SAM-dependent methyltransferase